MTTQLTTKDLMSYLIAGNILTTDLQEVRFRQNEIRVSFLLSPKGDLLKKQEDEEEYVFPEPTLVSDLLISGRNIAVSERTGHEKFHWSTSIPECGCLCYDTSFNPVLIKHVLFEDDEFYYATEEDGDLHEIVRPLTNDEIDALKTDHLDRIRDWKKYIPGNRFLCWIGREKNDIKIVTDYIFSEDDDEYVFVINDDPSDLSSEVIRVMDDELEGFKQ